MDIIEIINTPTRKLNEIEIEQAVKNMELVGKCIKQIDNWSEYKRHIYGLTHVREIEKWIHRSLSEMGNTTKNEDINAVSKIIFYSENKTECLLEQNFKNSLKNIESYFVENGFLKRISIIKRIEQQEFKVMANFTNAIMGNLRLPDEPISDKDFKFFKLMKRGNPQFYLNFERTTQSTEKTLLFFKMMYGFAMYLDESAETKGERFENLGKTESLKNKWLYKDFNMKDSRLIEFDLKDFIKRTNIIDSNGKHKKELLIRTISNYNGQMLPVQSPDGSGIHWTPAFSIAEVYDSKFLIKLGLPFINVLKQFQTIQSDIFNLNKTAEDWFLFVLLSGEYLKRFEIDPVFIISQNDIVEYYTNQTKRKTYKNQKKRTFKNIDKSMKQIEKCSFIESVSKINDIAYNELLKKTKYLEHTKFYNETPIKETETAYLIRFKQSDKKIEYKNKQKKIKTDKK